MSLWQPCPETAEHLKLLHQKNNQIKTLNKQTKKALESFLFILRLMAIENDNVVSETKQNETKQNKTNPKKHFKDSF